MIKKLALFCYRHSFKKVVGLIWGLIIPSFIFFCVYISFLRYIDPKMHPELVGAIAAVSFVLTLLIMCFFALSFNYLKSKGSRLPEIVLEEARKTAKGGLENPAMQYILEHCIFHAENRNFSYLMEVWPKIKVSLAAEKAIEPYKKEIKKAEKEVMEILANSRNICCRVLSV